MFSRHPHGMRLGAIMAAALMSTSLAAGTAYAQNANGANTTDVQGTASPAGSAMANNSNNGIVVDLKAWDTSNLSQGISTNWLIGSEAHGPNGNVVGDVENIVVGPDGQIQRLMIASGGFLDIGDTNYGVPWQDVQIPKGRFDWVNVPVTQDNLSKFPTYPEDVEKVTSNTRNWQPRELIGDRVQLNDVSNYGYVSDIIFNRSGQVASVVVNPAHGYGAGYYAMPWYGYGYNNWSPGNAYYTAPYSQQQVEGIGAYDYNQMPAGSPRPRGRMQNTAYNGNGANGMNANGANSGAGANANAGANGAGMNASAGLGGNGVGVNAGGNGATATVVPNNANGNAGGNSTVTGSTNAD